MERFNYLATFVSLVLGLGVTNILSQVSALAKRRTTVDWYWVHTVFCVTLFVTMAGEWWILLAWSLWPGHIDYYIFLSFLLKPSILFFASDLLFPEDATAPTIDLKKHYYDVRPVFYSVLLVYPLADLLDSVLKGPQRLEQLGPPYWAAMAGMILAYLGGIFIRNERYHRFLAIFFIVTCFVGFVLVVPKN